MASFPYPDTDNSYLMDHVNLLRNYFLSLTRKDLVDPGLGDKEAAKNIFHAPFAVVSHDTSKDPIFNYANQTALNLFEMGWEEFVSLPSRLSAEALDREERARLLNEVSTKGFMDHYSGIRISKSGKRFFMNKAIVWNLLDKNGLYYGQAATFNEWKLL
ncbi:MAG TPA: MEKHLA domain-containing protein [Nitrospiria bacterium]